MGEVRLYRGVPLPPGVPSLYALRKDVEMRLVCHIAQIPLFGAYTPLPRSYAGCSIATAMSQR